MLRFSWKNGQKMTFFHVFWGDQAKFFGFPLEYLDEWASFGKVIKFLNFGTYFKLMAHPVPAREPPKAKKSKIRVTRKPDLETQNWVCSFSSFIERYQTHIVTAQMLFDCWTVFFSKRMISRKNWRAAEKSFKSRMRGLADAGLNF
jgi:hypothetical protein